MSKNVYCFLIDDDEDDRNIFSIALSMIGKNIEADYAYSGIDAIKKLKLAKRVPDFIFLDLNMQVMNGGECLVELKKIAHIAEVPVIIYSTTLTEDIKYSTLRDGAFDHIEKPDKIETLVKYLKRVFQIED